MKFEIYLKRKACIDDAQTARKKVAYVVAKTVAEAVEMALKRAENSAFILDGTPRRSQ